MKKSTSILLLVLLLIGSTAHAQFKKPLQSSSRATTSEARYNIGLVGGLTSTYWLHFGGTKTPYHMPFNFGPTAGLSIERMINNNSSVSLEGLFAMRKDTLSYEVLNFPVAVNENKDYLRKYKADYQEVNVQLVYTHYFSQRNIRPYVFVGPRFTLPVSIPKEGTMVWNKQEILHYGTDSVSYIPVSTDTIAVTAQGMRQWNAGVVAGVGVLFKINVGNYYLLLKADVSGHAAVINSFTSEEIHGESQHVVGAGYIDPYLLGMRFNTDVTAKVTLMFPLKKQLQGACIRWGEYD